MQLAHRVLERLKRRSKLSKGLLSFSEERSTRWTEGGAEHEHAHVPDPNLVPNFQHRRHKLTLPIISCPVALPVTNSGCVARQCATRHTVVHCGSASTCQQTPVCWTSPHAGSLQPVGQWGHSCGYAHSSELQRHSGSSRCVTP